MADDALLQLPAGLIDFSGPLCRKCGAVIDKCAQDTTRAKKMNWNFFCSLKCFRAFKTKYHDISPKERQKRHIAATASNRALKASNRIKIE